MLTKVKLASRRYIDKDVLKLNHVPSNWNRSGTSIESEAPCRVLLGCCWSWKRMAEFSSPYFKSQHCAFSPRRFSDI